MTTQNIASQGDLFFAQLVDGYCANRRFVRRDWLAQEVDRHLAMDGCRFVLLTAEPGFGKSAFVAQLASDHDPHNKDREVWLRYFIRRDQRTPLGGVDSSSFLTRIGYQLVAQYPELFELRNLEVRIQQHIGTVAERGEVIGADVKRIIASPFCRQILDIQQSATANAGRVISLRVEELVSNPQLDLGLLANLALFDPARALLVRNSTRRIVILVDALDELRYHDIEDNILKWLTNCPELPANIRFVLTSRLPDVPLQVFIDKQRPYLQVLSIKPESAQVRADVQVYVDSLVRESQFASALAKKEPGRSEFTTQLVDKANGNLGYLDALARAIDNALARQDAALVGTLLTLQNLPDALKDLYAFFLHQIRAEVEAKGLAIPVPNPENRKPLYLPAWPAVYQPLLAVLSVALAPLALDQMKDFGEIGAERVYVLDALGRLRQFLDETDGRYRLYHASVPEFLTAARTRDSEKTADLYVDSVEWHGRIADTIWETHSRDWSTCDDYDLNMLATHLYYAGSSRYERLYALINPTWRRLKLDRLKSDSSFLADVERALAAARQEFKPPRYISLSLMAGSIATKANDLIPEALGAMVALGQNERDRAYVETMSEPGIRTGALLQMARSAWYLGDKAQARRYFETALDTGQGAYHIYTNPEPLLENLIEWGLIEEAVQVADLLNERMVSAVY